MSLFRGVFASSNDVNSSNIAFVNHSATSKATPVDNDELPIADSAASWELKKLTWANLKATIASAFGLSVTSTRIPYGTGTGLSSSPNLTFTSSTNKLYLGGSTVNSSYSDAFTVRSNPVNNISGTYYYRSFDFSGDLKILSGVTNSGYFYGAWFSAVRNEISGSSAGDHSGTLAIITAINCSYGHSNTLAGETPTTTSVYGLRLYPYNYAGTISNLYDFYISDLPSSGTVTNRWSIYQVGTGSKNYLGSPLGVGINSPSAMVHAIKTTEQLRLGYDASYYASFTVSSAGNLTLTNTGTTIYTDKVIENTVAGAGIVLKSPDGTRYRITVANGGTLTVAAA